jgi:MFS family permease
MYQVQDSQALVAAHRRLFRRRRGDRLVAKTVLLLGLTSLFTDISSEMVATILPLYLVYTVGLSPVAFGLVDGLYQGAGALVRVASGFVGDRFRRHKDVAAVGYGLSAACKLGFLAVGGAVGALSAVIVLDRTGKGIRTAPRDALISLSTPREQLGTAFGVHRALDTTGAMLGPLLAFGLLALAPGRFDTIFVVSFCIALVGLGILVLFVENDRGKADADAAEPAPPPPSLRAACSLLGSRRFAAVVGIGCALGLATMSDGFVYVALQHRLDFETRFLPLLYVATAGVYMLLAVPLGRLADRIGRLRVFLGGYALLLVLYGALLVPALGPAALVGCVLLFGAYYASTDGVLMALASPLLPSEVRGSGLALVTTGTTLSRLVGSLAFGALWTFAGLEPAVVVFAAGLCVALAATAILARRVEPTAAADA